MVNALGIAAVVVTGVTLLLAILATAIVHWSTFSIGNFDYSTGLWKNCVDNGQTSSCEEFALAGDAKTNYQSVRAMMILGILITVASLVCGILVLFVMKEMKILFFVAGGLDIAAGLFLMIGFAVYADKIKLEGTDYGACFALDIVAWLLAWVGGALFIVCKIMNKE